MKRITQTKEIQTGDNSGIVFSGNEKASYSETFEASDFSENELITKVAVSEMITAIQPTGSGIEIWSEIEAPYNENSFVTYVIGDVEYLFRSDFDNNNDEPTLNIGTGPAWTDLAHNGFPTLWDEVTPFSIDEWVFINDGGVFYTYTSKIAGNLNNLPPVATSDDNWLYKGITRGYFPDDAPYNEMDIVLNDDDDLFISNLDDNNYALDEDAPFTSKWQLIGIAIKDDEVSDTSTWSSEKIKQEISFEKSISTTVSGLRTLENVSDKNLYQTTDLGGGNWYYDSNDTTTADNTGTILSSIDGGRFKRIIDNIVNVKWFGAVSDYIKASNEGTDNTLSFQKAIDFLVSIGGGTLYVPTGNFLISGTVYINIGGSRPITITGDTLRNRTSSAVVTGSSIFKNTSGDIFKCNLKSDGSKFLPVNSGYAGFGCSGISFYATVAGCNIFSQFWTSSNIQNISADGFEWVVFQPTVDTEGTSNYCDKSYYIFIHASNIRKGVLRLLKPDSSVISMIFIEGDAFLYDRGIEVLEGHGFTINNILCWFRTGSDPGFTPVADSRLINLSGCSAVNIDSLHIEHCPSEYMIALSSCESVTISDIHDRFSRRYGVLVGGDSKGIWINNWNSESDIISGSDIHSGNGSTEVEDVTYVNCYFKSFAGIKRDIIITYTNGDHINFARTLDQKLIYYPVTDNIAPKANSCLYLGSITVDKIITLPVRALNYGKQITIFNRNIGVGVWSFSSPIKDTGGNMVSILEVESSYILECDERSDTGWIIISKYIGLKKFSDFNAIEGYGVIDATVLTPANGPDVNGRGEGFQLIAAGNKGFKRQLFIQSGSWWRRESTSGVWGQTFRMLDTSNVKYGTFITSGSGQETISIPHGLGFNPNHVIIQPQSVDSINANYISVTKDSTNIIITLAVPANVGTNNLTYSWEAKR